MFEFYCWVVQHHCKVGDIFCEPPAICMCVCVCLPMSLRVTVNTVSWWIKYILHQWKMKTMTHMAGLTTSRPLTWLRSVTLVNIAHRATANHSAHHAISCKSHCSYVSCLLSLAVCHWSQASMHLLCVQLALLSQRLRSLFGVFTDAWLSVL